MPRRDGGDDGDVNDGKSSPLAFTIGSRGSMLLGKVSLEVEYVLRGSFFSTRGGRSTRISFVSVLFWLVAAGRNGQKKKDS